MNEIKIQTDHMEDRKEDVLLQHQLDTEEREIHELEKKLNQVPENDSNYSSESEEVRVFEQEDIEVKPLDALLPLPGLRKPPKPVIVKQPPFEVKPKKKKKDVEEDDEGKPIVSTTNQEVNTILVMPTTDGNGRSKQHRMLDEHVQMSRSLAVDTFGASKSPTGAPNWKPSSNKDGGSLRSSVQGAPYQHRQRTLDAPPMSPTRPRVGPLLDSATSSMRKADSLRRDSMDLDKGPTSPTSPLSPA